MSSRRYGVAGELNETPAADRAATRRDNTRWAEVNAIISETKEEIDRGYGYVQNSGTIIVDGKKGGKVTYTLVPRRKTTIFHEACDAISDELQETGCTFCDTRGRPRLDSVKQAMKNNDTKGYILYINTFELVSDYRNSTWVGAKALRSLLEETKLAGTWSLAVYIPSGSTQFNEEESKKSDEVRRKRREASDKSLVRTPDEIKEEKEWNRHFDALTKQDMRQFFRAGFQQAKETVFDSDCFYVFCVPSFLDNAVLSHEEALTVEIDEKKASVNEPTGKRKELLEYMVTSCGQRKRLKSSLRAWEIPLREQYRFRQLFEAIDRQQSELLQQLNVLNAQIAVIQPEVE